MFILIQASIHLIKPIYCQEASLKELMPQNSEMKRIKLTNICEFIWNCRLLYIINATLGAFIIILNRENNTEKRHYYVGTSKVLTYTFRWDTENPYHCSVYSTRCPQFLSAPDQTEEVSNCKNAIETFSFSANKNFNLRTTDPFYFYSSDFHEIVI